MKKTGAVVVSCMDFRFQRFVPSALEETFGVKDPDYISLPGGVYQITRVFVTHAHFVVKEAIDLAVERHRVSKIILLNHQNCGMYAKNGSRFDSVEEESKFHSSELKKARLWARRYYPDTDVFLGFMTAQETGVEIVQVK